MGRFHDRMDRDLRIRGYSERTREIYLSCVRRFVQYFMRPPDELGIEEIHAYQLHLAKERKLAWSSFNQAVCALRFFYGVTLQRDVEIRNIPYRKTGRKLPEVLSAEEVAALLRAPSNLKHQALLTTVYAAGLRVGEAVHLRVADIDSRRMVLRVEQGKGCRDRYVMLAPGLLALLRRYWRVARPRPWLFPGGGEPGIPITPGSVRRVFQRAKQAAGISKPVCVHGLRHAFATHLLERGVNLRVIQRLLGHRSGRSIEIYTHVAQTYLRDTASPLDAVLPELVAAPTG